jgi:hypothetical protein
VSQRGVGGILRGVLVLLALFAAADTRDATAGPMVGAGFGVEQTRLGVQIAYQLPLRDMLAVTPFGAAGVWSSHVGFSAGARATFGRQARLAVEVLYGPVGLLGLRLYGEPLGERLLYGFAALAGVEWVGESGFFCRAMLGASYALLPLATVSDRFDLALNAISVGYKLW